MSNASSGVTVVATPPSAPVIATSTIAANSTTSITGTIAGSTDSIEVYIDGIKFGKTTAASGTWTLSSINTQELYKSGVVTAKNVYTNSRSVASNSVTVVGVDSFSILATGGGAIGVQKAGEPFNVKLQALQLGSNFSQYVGTNMFSSQFTFISGSGPTSAFTSGALSSHALNIQNAGTYTITTLSSADPTVKGSSTAIQVVPNVGAKLKLRTTITDTCLHNTVFPQQPVIEITDTYGNFIDSASYNAFEVTASIFSGFGTLSGTQTVSFVNGVATFTNLKVSNMGDYTIRFNLKSWVIIKY